MHPTPSQAGRRVPCVARLQRTKRWLQLQGIDSDGAGRQRSMSGCGEARTKSERTSLVERLHRASETALKEQPEIRSPGRGSRDVSAGLSQGRGWHTALCHGSAGKEPKRRRRTEGLEANGGVRQEGSGQGMRWLLLPTDASGPGQRREDKPPVTPGDGHQHCAGSKVGHTKL